MDDDIKRETVVAQLVLALLLAAGAATAQAQPPTIQVQPSVDSAEQRKALRDLTMCLAKARPNWARRTLSQPYLSDAQATTAAEALTGKDTCLRRSEVEVTFRTSSLVGSLAELFLRADIEQVDFSGVQARLSTLVPRNVTEDFALCVADHDPFAARDLALSEPGDEAEMLAARKLAAHVAPCTAQGEQLTVDVQALRALMATALYRGVSSLRSASQ